MFHWDAENVNVMNGIKMLKMFVMNGNNEDVEIFIDKVTCKELG